jgi:two-component sensor histidine kinase
MSNIEGEDMSEVYKLCKKFTNLSDEDISKLEIISETLQGIADLVKADVFIDCPTRYPDAAIVIAEAKPTNAPSLYKGSVVGQLALRANEPAVLRTLEIGMVTRDLKATTQEFISVKQTVHPIKNKHDKTIGVLIVEKDITQNINNNICMEILAETNERLSELLNTKGNGSEKSITNHIDDAIIIFDETGIVVFTNPVAEELYKKLGYKDELLGMHFDNVSLYNCSLKDILENNKCEVFEIDIGQLSFQVKYVVQNSRGFSLVMFIRDITEVKQKEKELILKSVAIKEIHHRVKNNLQTIASLLRLQTRRINNEEFRSALSESINRILSIAATHEILAQQGIDDVNIKEVIIKVKRNIMRCYNVENRNIKVSVEGDEFTINSDKATSIALIINELLQNSLKYAFKNREDGNITITIQKGRLYSTISIVDDGVGFDVNSIKPNSLGLNIVKSLVKDKLNGNLNICSNLNGTKVLFDFIN